MKIGAIIYTFPIILASNINLIDCNSKYGILSRHKRYVVFPEGSSLTVAICVTTNIIGIPQVLLQELTNFGINYELPNRTVFQDLEPQKTTLRRNKRDLYNKFEIILDALGLNGKSCIYKALCEVPQILEYQGRNMMEEIIRRLLYFPLDKLHYLEPEDHKNYYWAHKIGHEQENCQKIFPNCHVSLIELLLGYNYLNHQ